MRCLRVIGFAALCCVLSLPALAQSTQISVATPETAPGAEVEITSDTLAVNRETGEAVFAGSVVVTQGPLKLIADEVVVLYGEASGTGPARVSEVNANGNVFFASGEDAAESQSATYRPDDQELRMAGDVLLKQGPVVVAGDALVLDLATGLGQMEGRVRTVLQPDAQ